MHHVREEICASLHSKFIQILLALFILAIKYKICAPSLICSLRRLYTRMRAKTFSQTMALEGLYAFQI